ncbi:DNA methyltransferase [Pseudoalteromonas rubra]|uniref:site-specific DNA-methyltransferase (adenine-specific) n=1 Tax=Pseudoalteromonas rubra TaxID=43658 RepID=A0A4Q7EMG5_9GAMM|nr:DNA adenine methylase [Pseudoalteromonas rubra]RZM84941.1 DNA methyltransferase [Pseudoalteromonas rubra]
MKFFTPLRYPGGKGKLSYYVKSIIESNNLLDGHYVEPFAGGAGVALELLFHEYVNQIHINDLDPAVYAFWFACVNKTEELCKLISDTPVTIGTWERQRKLLRNEDNSVEPLELAFATFFLNRTNRSGILKAGVIGGRAQAGKWKLDVRFNKEDLIKRIEMIANYRNRINIYNFDTVDLLNTLPQTLPQNTLIYLDPPYYVKGQGLYRNFYEHKDHVEIKNILDTITEIPWIVSYDNAEQISNIYSDYRTKVFDLQYTAQTKRVASEIMIFSDSVNIPDTQLGKRSA